MSRGLKYDIPGDDWRCGMDEVAAQGWEAIFAKDLEAPLRLVVEIGFGRGEFLLDLAAKNPNTAFIGIDVSFKRTLKMARKLSGSGLRNVRLLEGRGQVVVEQLLWPDTIQQIWINFPDPWPKDRHTDRRLIEPELVRATARALVAGGSLMVATDDAPYAKQIDRVLSDEPLLENCFAPAAWHAEASDRIETGYQRDWIQRKRPLYFFEYRRLAAPNGAGMRP